MRTVIAIVLLAAIALSGCSSTQNVNSNTNRNKNQSTINVNPNPPIPIGQPDASFTSCNPYFPLRPGSKYTYNINYPTGLVVTATIVVEEMEQNGRKIFVEKIHLIDQQTKGLEYIQNTERRYICDGQRIVIIYEESATKVRETRNRASFNYGPDTVYLPDPESLNRPDFTWTMGYTYTLTSDIEPPAISNQTTFVNVKVVGEEEVTLPVGKFKAVKIKKDTSGALVNEYYVKGLGLGQRETSEGLFWKLDSYSGVN